MRHPRAELLACLGDDQGDLTAMQMHISRLRPLIRQRGEDIICELAGRAIYYRHVRLLANSE